MRAALLLAAVATLCTVIPRGVAQAQLVDFQGGLSADQTPQFVLLTHDDGVSSSSRDTLRAVTDGRQTPDGCPVVATLFAKVGNTNCEALLELYELGYEVADHSVNHKRLYGEDPSFVEEEVVGCRSQLAECGVPQGDIVGFRAPYLDVDDGVRDVLHRHGFLYDSSLVVDSPDGFGQRLWPFDMGSGIPVNCSNWDGPYGTHRQACQPGEVHPGLWEVPVYRMGEVPGEVYHMDPGFDYTCMCHASARSALDIMTAHFDVAYAGNRAPFPLYVHPFWLREGTNVEQLQQFVDYALSKPHVYFVTMRQLIAWMQGPVPAGQLTPEALGCGNLGGAPGAAMAPVPAPSPARRLLST